MDKHESYIDFPNDDEIESEINSIIAKGLKPQQSFYFYVKSMYKQIGIKNLFHDITEIVFLVLIVLSILIFIAVSSRISVNIDNGNIYSFIFIFSPILYLTISLLSFINTKQKNTFEIEMTCKYNIYQLAAFRMLVFSAFCIVLNVSTLYLVSSLYNRIDFLQALMISVTSLFLFSTIFLYLILKVYSKVTKYFVLMGWVIMNLGASIFSSEFYTMFLNKIPFYVYLTVTVICLYAFIYSLKKLITFNNIGGMIKNASN
ncbi:hypothetical protein [Clostridium estertheticum]|uniref:hypothetical protein n=1 Tax=Clostridium estertheticum TaxID=238834 RepID=UPI001C7DC7EA|nr:hypothetical protein [Clostridium estertheticum]MBX4265874.1 hypothetical protein [Clostridium estertheticum]WLC86728.1 hypothetical protein KTC95_10965 [Clostridium estertheticum]